MTGSVAKAGLQSSSPDALAPEKTSSGTSHVEGWRAVVPNVEHESVTRVSLGPIDPDLAKENRWYRLLEVTATAAGLAVLAPWMALIAIAIKLDSRGPVLFRQRRVGKFGNTFMCLKFRTMVPDAAGRLAALLESDPAMAAEFAAHQKLERDPRVTRVGRILRKAKLDELPQLLNVLRNEMALVGPRPIVIPEVVRYGEHASVVFSVRPGITGQWQAAQDESMSYDRRVALDMEYVHNRSTMGDIRIILATLAGLLDR
ncbi:MAG: sugar transferase [Acidimicrobiia bacterium]|nr:sugar transferase [Acidimicrobiia bacterium]